MSDCSLAVTCGSYMPLDTTQNDLNGAISQNLDQASEVLNDDGSSECKQKSFIYYLEIERCF